LLTWTATYDNGEVICEKQINYFQLKRQGLRSLKLVDEKGSVKAEVTSNNGEVLFYRINTIINGSNSAVVSRLWYLGWRKRVDGHEKTHAITLTPNGAIIGETDNFQNVYWDWTPQEQV